MDMTEALIEDLQEIFEGLEEDKEDEELRQDAEENLKQLAIHVHSISDKTRKAHVKAKITEFKAKLNEANRNALFHTDGPRREMTQSEKQQNSLQILKDSVATLHETEEVGNSIMTDLGKQKETIKHARGNLKTTNSDLKYSGKLVAKMSKWWRG